MEVMTTNIAKATDDKLKDKLELMLQRINANIAQQLKEINNRVEETEGRILAVENTRAEVEGHIASLVKSLGELTERLQDYKNRGNRKNLRILGIHKRQRAVT